MDIMKDLAPLEAMQLFYDGEVLGDWPGDFRRYEKERGIQWSPKLKEFLMKYSHFELNRGVCRLWAASNVVKVTATVVEKEQNALAFGMWGTKTMGILEKDLSEDDPAIIWLTPYNGAGEKLFCDPYWGVKALPEGETFSWRGEDSGIRLNSVFADLFIENLADQVKGTQTYQIDVLPEGSSEQEQKDWQAQYAFVFDELARFSDDEGKDGLDILAEMAVSCEQKGYVINYAKQERTFIVMCGSAETIYLRFIPQTLSMDELKRLFHQAFAHPLACYYTHALSLAKTIIARLEAVDEKKQDRAELHKYMALAGRCCWEIKQWDEGEQWYQKAEELLKDEMNEMLERADSFYAALGNFYHDKGDSAKSEQSYQESERLADMCGDIYRKGLLRQARGQHLVEANRLAEAIQFYDEALAEFEKMPGEHKYELARTKQMRDEAQQALQNESNGE